MELALTTAPIAAGLDARHALAAALLYRLVTLWLTTSIGWLLHAGLTTHVLHRVHTARPAE